MDKIIHAVAHLRCDARRAFEMFTINGALESWLVPVAEVEAFEGEDMSSSGSLRIAKNYSTIDCRVTAIAADRFLSFEWKGPKQFKHFMNVADPLTHVTVFFVPSPVEAETTEAHLLHSGWRSSDEWEAARLWFERAWGEAFKQLEAQINNP